MRKLRKMAGRADAEPLEPEDWEVVWRMHGAGEASVLVRSARCRAARAARSAARRSRGRDA